MSDFDLIFLHGGGDAPGTRDNTFGRVARAILEAGDGPLLIVAAATTEAEARATADYYAELFAGLAIPVEQLQPVLLGPNRSLSAQELAEWSPAALFVCGGTTPVYHEALCADLSWVDYVRGEGIIYAGTSAGAAIAAHQAILGGWRTAENGSRPMIFPGAGEGLERLTVRPGAGLVPFTVEIHAGQMGTLTRLVQTVAQGLVAGGVAIDEDTLLVVAAGEVRVYGRGHVYQVEKSRQGRMSIRVQAAIGY